MHARSFTSALTIFVVGGCQQAPPPSPMIDLLRAAQAESCVFGGDGEIIWEEGALELDPGSPLTGLRWPGFAPGPAYEVEVWFRRIAGVDFPLCLTFPVGDSHCSLVLGGWGGTVCGLSNIDGADADNNASRQLRHLPDRALQKLRLRVDPEEIRAVLNGELLVAQPRAGHRFSLRPEVDPCRPFGVASFNTTSRIERLRWRPLSRGPRAR